MTTNTLLADPRRRNLIALAAVAIVTLLFALLAVWRQSASTDAKDISEFFPGFAQKVAHHEATRIRIVSKANGVVEVAFTPRGWVVVSRGGFPASFEQVNATLVGMAAMQTLERKTSRAQWLRYVGLDSPPKGDGVLVTVSNERGETLAALVAGKTTDIADQTGATGLFVRKPDSDQSWLVRAVSEIRSSTADWMEKSILDVDRARIQGASVTPILGPAYAVHRDRPNVPDFTLLPVPNGRETSDPTVVNGVADAVVGFSFEDARRATELDFSKSAWLVTRTFDGLIVSVRTIKAGNDYWAMVSADAPAGKALAAREARDINARARGWAYKLADFKGAQFTTPLENLLKPKGAPAKTAP